MPAIRLAAALPKGAIPPGIWTRLRDLRDRPGRERRETSEHEGVLVTTVRVDPPVLGGLAAAALFESDQIIVLEARRVELPPTFLPTILRAAREHGGAVASVQGMVVQINGIQTGTPA